MKDYLRLKQMNTNSNKKINEEIKVTKDEKQTKIEQQKVELSEMDLETALKEIENLNIGDESSISTKDSSITEKTIEQKEALKEFWE
jgi:fructose-1-phosphate kinase PfkB-like protein